jgi:hypothetical protein
MKTLHTNANRSNDDDLERVLEPLASYICATDRPRAALKVAVAALFQQVEQTNRAASARVAALLERQVAVPA